MAEGREFQYHQRRFGDYCRNGLENRPLRWPDGTGSNWYILAGDHEAPPWPKPEEIRSSAVARKCGLPRTSPILAFNLGQS